MTIPTIAELRDQFLADLESTTGQTAPLLPKAVWRVLALAVAGIAWPLYRLGLWLYDQIFTDTMDRAALLLRGREYGLTIKAATRWRGTVEATGTDGVTIPAGTLFVADGFVYRVESAVTISSGAASLTLESLETGDEVSLAVSDTLELSVPIAGVDREATVTAVTQAAEDEEALALFRARIRRAETARPQGGAFPDWILWATEVPGIAEAIVERPAAGFVNIYPLTDDPDPANRIPGGAKLTEVEDYVTDPVRSPIRAASVDVLAPTELDFDVDISDLSPNTAATQAAIEAAIEAYMYERRPQQYDTEVDPRNVVSQVEVAAIVKAAGAQVATVDLKNAGGSSIVSYELAKSELAVLRTLSWV